MAGAKGHAWASAAMPQRPVLALPPSVKSRMALSNLSLRSLSACTASAGAPAGTSTGSPEPYPRLLRWYSSSLLLPLCKASRLALVTMSLALMQTSRYASHSASFMDSRLLPAALLLLLLLLPPPPLAPAAASLTLSAASTLA